MISYTALKETGQNVSDSSVGGMTANFIKIT